MGKIEIEAFLLYQIKERHLDSIKEWFDEWKRPFYLLGKMYQLKVEEIENVFYETIIEVYDTVRKWKAENDFVKWVTTIFLHKCRALSQKTEIEDEDILGKLSHLETNYKEPIALVYIMGFTQNEAADLLDLNVETITANIGQGIQKLTRSSNIEDHHEFHADFIHYLNRTMDRKRKIDLEIHLHTCEICQQRLASYQDIILSIQKEGKLLEAPTQFFQHVVQKVNETIESREIVKKKRQTKVLSIASIVVLLLFIGYVTNTFSNIYYSWVDWRNDENDQLRAFYKSGVGERLNLEAESNGIKVKIKSVIADEFQTLIYYEIEDVKNENQYMMSMYDGVRIANDYEIVDHSQTMFFTPTQLDSEKENIFRGTVSLQPIRKDGVLELEFSKLQKVPEDMPVDQVYWIGDYNSFEFVDGDWSFEIPVKKHPSIVYDVGMETEVEGVPITISKLILAPTTTVLEYEYNLVQGNENINNIFIEKLATEEKDFLTDQFGFRMNQEYVGNRITTKLGFDSMYTDKPEKVEVHFDSFNVFVEDKKTIDIDVTGDFPLTFEYLGNKISIDDMKIGNPTVLNITDNYHEGREYERLEFNFLTSNDPEEISYGTYTGGEGVYIDRNGNEFELDTYPNILGMKERPRYFQTKFFIELQNHVSNEEVIPETMVIEGYHTTKYTDDVVSFTFD